eukprot:749481-Hanusia_phi.AAC.2
MLRFNFLCAMIPDQEDVQSACIKCTSINDHTALSLSFDLSILKHVARILRMSSGSPVPACLLSSHLRFGKEDFIVQQPCACSSSHGRQQVNPDMSEHAEGEGRT